ncbi:SH3 domain-containing protein [Acetobacter suratthaniensis]|uniref:Aspartyl-tRNA synthetase n=1 Tax=Acetobacter suratthaniensis TaxID=1502841 RepID=A0ABS3LH73_9PROT|nr:SH3 domain-containing protein [Acetobacter suratthaniensis]MBO1326944.1 hypothetical protein [Acetobacter suratthaniensis]MCX2565446.1 SH3 domain-containing protein [Acetobacter suratthaniensis]
MTVIRSFPFSVSLPRSGRLRCALLACVTGLAVLPCGAQAATASTDAGKAAKHHHHHHAESASADAAKTAHHGSVKKTAHKTGASTKAEKKADKKHHAKSGAKEGAHAHHGHAAAVAAHTEKPHHHAAVAAAGAAGAAGAVAAAGAATAATPDPAAAAAQAPATPDLSKGTVTGLPLPRYAALRSDEVNMRAGPGRRFPILWVYHRRGMPVKVEREFDVWRLVEDQTGQKGWMQQATLSGGRDFLIPGEAPGDQAPIPAKGDQNGDNPPSAGHMDSREVARAATPEEAAHVAGGVMLRATADQAGAIVAVLQPGTVGSIKECPQGSGWCRVSVHQYNGWLPRQALWGVEPDEVLAPS